MKTKTPFLLWLLATVAISAFAADTATPQVRFAKPIPPAAKEVPDEAETPKNWDSKEHGAFKNLVAGRIASLTVTWADPQRFKTQQQTEQLLRDLLTTTNTQTWTYHVWSFPDGGPSLVVTVTHTNGTEGKWVIWAPPPGLYWAYKDEKQKWWWGQWDPLKAPYPKAAEKPPAMPYESSAHPKFTFENRPELGLPAGAAVQDREEPGMRLDVLLNTVLDGLTAVRVRYYGPEWKTEKDVQSYLIGLFSERKIKASNHVMWSEDLAEPDIECQLTFNDIGHGRLLLWRSEACLQDASGRWWFFWIGDYYQKHHPNATK